MNTRMHQEAFPGEDISDRSAARGARARPARPDRGRPAERPLQRRRAAGGARVSVRGLQLTPANEASAPPAERDEVRLLVAQRGRPLVHDMFRGLPAHLRAGDLLVVNTSGDHARRAVGAASVDVHLSTPLPGDHEAAAASGRRAAAARAGSSSCAAAARATAAPGGERLELPGGALRRAPRARTSRPAACGSPRSTSRCRWTTTSPRTAARSPTRTSPSRARSRTSRRSSPTSPAARRCRAPAGRSPSACSTTSLARGVQVAPLVLHTGVSSPRARRAAVPRALPRPAAHRHAASTPTAPPAAA